jgi:hypothetical protein
MGTIDDLFERLPAGPVWVESSTRFHGLAERLLYLHAQCPGEYFASDVHEAKIVAAVSCRARTGLRAGTEIRLHTSSSRNPSDERIRAIGKSTEGRSRSEIKSGRTSANPKRNVKTANPQICHG